MGTLSEALRTGTWLTRERVRLVALALLLASALGAVFLIATSNGLNDRFGRPLGTDFSNVYAAGTYVLEGEAAAPFDPHKQYVREQAIFGPDTQFYGWHYPPFFLGLAGLLALLPYALALALWQGATLALYLLAIRAILRPPSWPGLSPQVGFTRLAAHNSAEVGQARPPMPSTSSFSGTPQGVDARHKAGHDVEERNFVDDKLWLLLALAYPAVFINLGHGHNGFLTAALMAGALTHLDRRPLIAGILIGLLAYKPQFGLLIPLVLAVSGRWRVFFAAAATVAALALAVTLAFGMDVWTAFFASTKFTRSVVLEQGGTGWYKIQSVFSWVRLWGGSVPLAYAVQGAATLAVAAALGWLWRTRAAFPLQAAALLIGTVLATPYVLDYDLMLLAPAIAFLAADGATRGFGLYEKTMLAALWLMPLIARSLAQATLIPLAVPLMLLVFIYLLRRAMSETGAQPLWRFAPRHLR
jgi:alpha-1,2-mannosyltransferase